MKLDEVVEQVGTQNSNLNQTQIEEARCYLSKVFGNYCGAGSEGKGCAKTVKELQILWEADFIKKGKPIPQRIHPFLVVNEKHGSGIHKIVNDKLVYCGNVNYFCKSCNMLYDRKTGDIQVDEKATFQSRKSHKVRPMFKNKLRNYLINNTHICFKECVNKWSGTNEFKCSQEVLENAFWQEYDITFDLIDIEPYGIKCTYKKCSGEHVIIKGEDPAITLDDYKSFMDEIAENKMKQKS